MRYCQFGNNSIGPPNGRVIMSHLISDIAREFRRHKSLADRAIAGLSNDKFIQRPPGGSQHHFAGYLHPPVH